MSFTPKRPSAPPNPAGRPPTAPTPARPGSSIRDASTEAHALGGGAIARPASSVRPGGKKTILIVHPDADLRSRLRTMLEPQYDVVEAKDGMEAVELTNSITSPGMVVSDTQMPRVDGFTLAKILRNNPIMKKTPIMFVSAQHSPQHVTQALVIGVSHYLPKTTPLVQIAEKIRKIVV